MVPVRLVTPGFLVNRPDCIKRVLQDNHANYAKGPLYPRLKPLAGEGLVTSEGELWRRQRRIAQPVFSRERIATFAAPMTARASAMLERWAPHAASGEPLDVHAEMMKLTLAVLGDTVFGIDLSRESDTVTRAVTTAIEITNLRVYSAFPTPVWWPTPQNRRYRGAIATLDAVVNDMIAKKRGGDSSRDDLLAMLMAARDAETGDGMSDKQLRDEAVTMLIAGYETMALVLAYTWHMLSLHPEVASKLHEEASRVLGDRSPTPEDARHLPLTSLVLHEVMRLYPPVWFIARRALADDTLGGQRVRAGDAILLSPYVTHRHPELWGEPERFDPERFTAERSEGRPRFAYFPFAAGPRQCIGNNFAMMEALLIVAMVLRRYRLRRVPGFRLELEASITLRPREGVQVGVEHAR